MARDDGARGKAKDNNGEAAGAVSGSRTLGKTPMGLFWPWNKC